MTRPDFIRHWTALEGADDAHYPGDDEVMGIGAPLGRALGLTRLGIHHVRLKPGRRTSYPHAESAEEEFVFVLEGTPDVWIDGELHRLAAGECVSFPAGTGICHTFLNSTGLDVRLLVVGEASRTENRVRYPLNAAHEATRADRWVDWPARPMGGHDGRAIAGALAGLPELATPRLRLRPRVEGDAEALFAIMSDPVAMRYWDRLPLTSLEEMREGIRRSAAVDPAFAGMWSVVLKESGAVIGFVAYHHRDIRHRRVEIGYMIAPSAWGRGLGREAVSALLGHCFETLEVHRAEATVDPDNAASRGLLMRLGFTLEGGPMRARMWIAEGEARDAMMFGLLVSDWTAGIRA